VQSSSQGCCGEGTLDDVIGRGKAARRNFRSRERFGTRKDYGRIVVTEVAHGRAAYEAALMLDVLATPIDAYETEHHPIGYPAERNRLSTGGDTVP
jgi:hypothetical protein